MGSNAEAQLVPKLDGPRGFCARAVQVNFPTRHGCGGEATRFEEARGPQPFVEADTIGGHAAKDFQQPWNGWPWALGGPPLFSSLWDSYSCFWLPRSHAPRR